jgi:hypothetical protein
MPDKEVNGGVVIVGSPQLWNAESPPPIRRHQYKHGTKCQSMEVMKNV